MMKSATAIVLLFSCMVTLDGFLTTLPARPPLANYVNRRWGGRSLSGTSRLRTPVGHARVLVCSMGKEQPEIVVVGSINYDQFVYVRRFPRAGETIYGTSYTTGFGGKGDQFE